MRIDPINMTLLDWVDNVSFGLRQYGLIPQLTGEDWVDWANHVNQVPGIQQQQPPEPFGYDDWKEWAVYFNDAVSY